MTKVLCILDGFGMSKKSNNNVPSRANMPNFRGLLKNYWWTTLNADGVHVGQESGLVGNSEVGHMNLGGLKLIPQLSYQITKTAANMYEMNKQLYPDQLFDPKTFLTRKFNQNNSKNIHLIGLFSTGTIHSDLRHWAGAIHAAGTSGTEKIVLHIISDGRDSDRKSLQQTWEYFITEFEDKIKPFEDKIFLGSIGGRFYSMDRDNNWDRVARGILPMFSYKLANQEDQGDNIDLKKFIMKKYKVDLNRILDDEKHKWESENIYSENFEPANFYHNLEEHFFFLKDDQNNRESIGPLQTDIKYILQNNTEKWYEKGVYDEVLYPKSFYYLPLHNKTRPFDGISKNDTVWLLNYRTDRMKQFSKMLCDINEEFNLNLDILGMNDYGISKEIYLDEQLEISDKRSSFGYYPIFKNQPVKNPLSERISQSGSSQLHIAETEKYNHVTYFFNGGQNKKWEGEDWFVIDSNKVTSHAEIPAMKAVEITDYILENGLGKYDYIIVNYANPDMLGHTGDIQAAIESMEIMDQQLGRLVEAVKRDGHKLVITADHGNVEVVGEYQLDGKLVTDTEHNPNPVPLIIVDEQFNSLELSHKVSSLVETYKLPADIGLVNKILTNQKNQVDITNQESWLSPSDIPEPKLPLWYAGLFILSM